jgi:hypothetical protein
MVEVWALAWVAAWASAAVWAAKVAKVAAAWVLECLGNLNCQYMLLSHLLCRYLHFHQQDILHKSLHHPIYSNNIAQKLHQLQMRWQELPTS